MLDEAKRSTMKTLVLFVPPGTKVPASVQRSANARGVTIRLIEVPWQPDYIPKASAGRKSEKAAAPPAAPAKPAAGKTKAKTK
jgi:hypothetical protein